MIGGGGGGGGIIIIIYSLEFFTSVLADGFSLESE